MYSFFQDHARGKTTKTQNKISFITWPEVLLEKKYKENSESVFPSGTTFGGGNIISVLPSCQNHVKIRWRSKFLVKSCNKRNTTTRNKWNLEISLGKAAKIGSLELRSRELFCLLSLVIFPDFPRYSWSIPILSLNQRPF